MPRPEHPPSPISRTPGQARSGAGPTFSCSIAECEAIRKDPAVGHCTDEVAIAAPSVDPTQAWCRDPICRLLELRPDVAEMRTLGEQLVWLSAHLDALLEIVDRKGIPAEDDELGEADYWAAVGEDLPEVQAGLHRLARTLSRLRR